MSQQQATTPANRGSGNGQAKPAASNPTAGAPTFKTRAEVLEALRQGRITTEQADEALEALVDRPRSHLYCRVSVKGALSIYGLQRMPVTLYVEQWERVLAPEFAEKLRAFVKEYENKPFHGTRKDEHGNVVQYTVTISRKARS